MGNLIQDGAFTSREFPKTSRTWEKVEADLDHFKSHDVGSSDINRLMTGLHLGEESVHQVCKQAYTKFFHTNAMMASTGSSLTIMQNDVLRWTANLLNAEEDAAGNFTSGGSESIFCAVHAAREWAKENKPRAKAPYNIVAPRTVHAAFDKAAHFQGLEIIRVPTAADYRADVQAMEEAVNENTIMIVGSAPNWGLGLIDPMEQIGSIAEKYDLWMHSDTCVGGFLLPFLERLGVDVPLFDFRIAAVRSMSADIHKHAYGAKPASTVTYRSKELQAYHYSGVAISDWQSGMYKTHGVTGSRPGAAVAAAWAVMSHLGEDGYLDLTRRALETKRVLVEGIEEIEDFEVLKNDCLLVPFRSPTLDMIKVFGGLVERGYFPWGTFDPVYIHPSAEPVKAEVLDRFLTDLTAVGTGVRDGSITAEAFAAYA